MRTSGILVEISGPEYREQEKNVASLWSSNKSTQLGCEWLLLYNLDFTTIGALNLPKGQSCYIKGDSLLSLPSQAVIITNRQAQQGIAERWKQGRFLRHSQSDECSAYPCDKDCHSKAVEMHNTFGKNMVSTEKEYNCAFRKFLMPYFFGARRSSTANCDSL